MEKNRLRVVLVILVLLFVLTGCDLTVTNIDCACDNTVTVSDGIDDYEVKTSESVQVGDKVRKNEQTGLFDRVK